jgi:hypothetical protein
MAKKSREQKAAADQAPAKSAENKNLPETKLTGVNAANTKSVLVSAMLEVHGQVRFGDGTDVGLTITETDMVLRPSDGAQLQKFIFAGSKRRGVDRRTIHELRDQHWNGGKCYVPELCCECPTCWLYGFTGTTQDKSINAKSRVLYASSVSVEEVQLGRNTHSRNQVDEKTQMTAGAAGIHEEEVIVAGVHFPTYTALIHVLDWEIGAFAHALLENVNSNRYTAASRAQGGIKFAEHDSTPLVVVDESTQSIFPLTAPKIAGWESDWQKASKVFQDAMNKDALKAALEAQGFTVVDTATSNAAANELALEASDGVITVKHGDHVLMTRYTGVKALGYLRQKQLDAKQGLMNLKADEFKKDISPYITAISPKAGAAASTAALDTADTGGDSDVSGNE